MSADKTLLALGAIVAGVALLARKAGAAPIADQLDEADRLHYSRT